MLLTGGVQQVVDRHLPQSQLEFCRLLHQTDMTEPSMHLSAPPHQLNEQAAGGLEEQALSAKKIQNTSQCKGYCDKNRKNNYLKVEPTNRTQIKTITCSNRGCGLPLQKFDNVHVAFLSIDSLACSFNCDSKGIKAPWLSTRSRHLGESPATLPNAQTAYK